MLYQRLQPVWKRLRDSRPTLALSGGLDSMVLLHLLLRCRADTGMLFSAAHVHHGLSANADAWARFCQDFCAAHDVPFHLLKVQVVNRGEGWEAAARKARYQALAGVSSETLLLAHHADDQRETFLLAALRGGGTRALAAMPAAAEMSAIRLLRPLLNVSRAELADYARAHTITHIEDESNSNPRFLRNWLRHQLLPFALQRLPQLPQQLDAAVAAAQQDLALLDEFTRSDREYVCTDGVFHCLRWRELSELRRRNLLHDFAKQHHLGNPTRAAVYAFERTLAAAPTQHAEWSLPHGTAVAHQGRLLPVPHSLMHPLWLKQPLIGTAAQLAQNCGMAWRTGRGFAPDILPHTLQLRPPVPSDRMMWRGTRKTVKRILQEHGVPPRLRPIVPIWCNLHGECLAISGIGVSDAVAVDSGLIPYLPDWENYFIRPNKQPSPAVT